MVIGIVTEPAKRYGSIYKITNLVNGKVYIGQTISTIAHRWSQHKHQTKNTNKTSIKLFNAIKKYGHKNFVIDEVCVCFDRHALDAAEKKLIQLYNCTDDAFGYNVQHGGGHTNAGLRFSAESRRKMSASKKGKKSGPDHPMFGKRLSPASIEKGANKKRIPVIGIHAITEEMIEFPSGKDVNNFGFHAGHVGECCQDITKTHQNYRWLHKKDFSKYNFSAKEVNKNAQFLISEKKKNFLFYRETSHMHTSQNRQKAEATRQCRLAAGEIQHPRLGKKHSVETRFKIAVAKTEVIYLKNKAGIVFEVHPLSQFCTANGLNCASMRSLWSGKRNSCYGWTKPSLQEIENFKNLK